MPASRCSRRRSPAGRAWASATASGWTPRPGPASFRVIGLTRNVQENGTVVFVPLATLQQVLRTAGRRQRGTG